MGAIYRIYNIETGKSYIGRSNRPYQRIIRHLMPDSSEGSPAIQEALLNHPPESWQWEIIADDKDYLGVSIDDLERRFIHQYDSRVSGYNIMPGGEGFASGDTQKETRLSWRMATFDRSQMRDRIVRAIADYQERTRAEHQRQQEIISEYGSLEAYRKHQQKQDEIRRRQARHEEARRENIGCLCVIGFFVILIFISLMTRGC